MLICPNGSADAILVDFLDIGVQKSWSAQQITDAILQHKPAVFNASNATSIDPYFLNVIRNFLKVDEDDNLQMASLICFFYLYAVVMNEAIPMKIKVESDIPIGAGLGSSAALSVCLAAGLLEIKKEIAGEDRSTENKAEVCGLALLAEKILHHTPSGIDNSVSTFGGLIKFVNGEVTCIADAPRLRVLLVNTGVSRDTKEVVSKVRRQMEAMPKVVGHILNAIDAISTTCLAALEDMVVSGETRENYDLLGELIDKNQKLLEALNVSHPALEDICQIAATHGLHGKLTGAGNGGFAFILLPPMASNKLIQAAKNQLKEKGYTFRETMLGVNGFRVQLENNPKS